MDNITNAVDDAFSSLNIKTEKLEDTVKKVEVECEKAGLAVHNKEKDEEQQKIFYGLTDGDREQAVRDCIVPRAYKDAYFDMERIRQNLIDQFMKSSRSYMIGNKPWMKYTTTCQNILSTIRMRKLPDRSYLIGAPNGFGKTSFVMECLITLRKVGYKVVPYISLWELAQIRIENEQRLMNPYKKFEEKIDEQSYTFTNPNVTKGFVKKPEIVIGRYSYSEYINADCLFVSFTDVISKDIESHTLYQLLSIRGSKGLPTIVMMSTSLVPYKNDRNLKETVWDEIEAYSEQSGCYDRVYHVSCYKTRMAALDRKNIAIDNETGIELE